MSECRLKTRRNFNHYRGEVKKPLDDTTNLLHSLMNRDIILITSIKRNQKYIYLNSIFAWRFLIESYFEKKIILLYFDNIKQRQSYLKNLKAKYFFFFLKCLLITTKAKLYIALSVSVRRIYSNNSILKKKEQRKVCFMRKICLCMYR